MTISELAKYVEHTTFEVKDGCTGKILCRNYDEKKHADIGECKILYVWAEIKTRDVGFGNIGVPIISAYVDAWNRRANDG